MARVFVAEETSLGRKVVVKLLPPELAAEVSVERFRREIQFAAHLQHPLIVPVLSATQQGALLYYTMPFVAGESLRVRLRRDGALPLGDAPADSLAAGSLAAGAAELGAAEPSPPPPELQPTTIAVVARNAKMVRERMLRPSSSAKCGARTSSSTRTAAS